MRSQELRIVAFVALILVVVFIMSAGRIHKETFTGSSIISGEMECPIAAIRTPDGRIKVQPGDHMFSSMDQYTTYLAGLYAKGSKCIPPMVQQNKTPVDQILGGLGVGAPSPSDLNREGAAREVLNTEFENEQTSANTPIRKLDDYEYTRVFDTERQNRNSISRQTKDELLSSRVLDWANLPFNSEAHAAKADEFVAGRMEDVYVEPKTGVFFRNAEGAPLLPPDAEAEKQREHQILASYRPTDISNHLVDSKTEQVAKLVNQMYENDPDWIPVVQKQNDNNYAITELLPKARKERWEDAHAQQQSLRELEQKGTVIPPPTLTIEDRMRDDPYFDKAGVGDRDNDRLWNYNDFRKWTPGLERMFAPTADNKEWF